MNLATPFGNKENRTEVSTVMDFALKGYDKDLETIRMGYRYYDPKSKKFLSADSYIWENPEKCIERPVECNLYTYAANNPISIIDPTGKSGLMKIITAVMVFAPVIQKSVEMGRNLDKNLDVQQKKHDKFEQSKDPKDFSKYKDAAMKTVKDLNTDAKEVAIEGYKTYGNTVSGLGSAGEAKKGIELIDAAVNDIKEGMLDGVDMDMNVKQDDSRQHDSME